MGIRLLLLACLLFGGTTTYSFAENILQGAKAHHAISGAELVRYSNRSSAPAFVRLRTGSEFETSLGDRWLRHILGMQSADGLVLKDKHLDHLGWSHQRYQQTYQGIPVEGSAYHLHAQHGKVVMANGDFFPLGQMDVQADLTEAAALQVALSHVNAQQYMWQFPMAEAQLQYETGNTLASFYPQGELVIAPEEGIFQEGKFRLAWKFDIYARQPLSRNFIYVDAQTGQVLWDRNRLHTADVQGTAQTGYSGTRTIVTDSTGPGNYRLREAGRGNGIETYDCNQGTNYGAAVDFTDTDNDWNNINQQLDQYATDAHWGAEMTYDYFLLEHNRNSINGNGFALFSYVHYDNQYSNAFWDGQRMTYGDGDGSNFTPLTAIDVTGHEITHGLTEFTANLIYQNESGALNESFSDIFGAAIEHYARPNQWAWNIGEDMDPSGNGIRNMSNPGQFGDPDTYLGPDWYTGAFDNGGVHINSGVQNFWYYLMVTGGNGTNGIGNNYNVTAQGWTKASAIAFRNLTVYLTPGSEYADARFYAIQSAVDLYGPCTPEVEATTDAWYAVGVGTPYVNAVISDFAASPNAFCEVPATVSFVNQSTNGGSFVWDFGDGTTSTDVNPSHTYTNFGTYTVALVADGGSCGMDTTVFIQYIDIDTSNPCLVTMSPGSNAVQTACSGILFDTGGPSSNYGDNENTQITIAPTGAASVTLTFSSFNFEDGYDYLAIYDGPNASSPLIGNYTGNSLPNGGTITSSNGAITLVATSDVFINEEGFELNWNCALPTAPPNANFEALNLTSCDGSHQFMDLSTNGANAWSWDFGDGGTSIQQNPSHTYAANGTYTVQLVATNPIGSDTIVRTAYVLVARPPGPAVPGVTLCDPGTATLNAAGSGGDVTWWDAPQGGAQVGTGNSYTTPVLSSTTTYYAIERVQPAAQYVGPANGSAVGGGGYHNNFSTQYLEFTVLADLELVSVYVDPGDAGNRTISLWNDQGQLIRDTSIFIPATPGRINIGWEIAPGSYRIGGTQMDLFRNNSGPSYPYVIANLVTITGSSAGGQYYYYLYDWEVQEPACVSEPTAVDVVVSTAPSGMVAASNGSEFCEGDSTVLTASGGDSYAWSTGASTPAISVMSGGTYQVTVTNAAGCSDTVSQSIQVFAAPAADFSFVTNQLTADFSDQSAGAVVWTWDFGDGNTGTGQTPSHTYAANGVYTVTLQVTNGDGCTDTISYPVEVIFVGVKDELGSPFVNLELFPNPFSEEVTVALELSQGGFLRIEAVDLLGKRVMPLYGAKAPAGSFTWNWRPEQLAEGSYILRIQLDDRVTYRKLVHLR